MFEINAIIMRVQTKVELKIRFGDSNGLRRNIRKRVLLIEVKTKKVVVAIRKIMFCAINIGDVTIRARIRLEMWTFGLVIIDALVSGI